MNTTETGRNNAEIQTKKLNISAVIDLKKIN